MGLNPVIERAADHLLPGRVSIIPRPLPAPRSSQPSALFGASTRRRGCSFSTECLKVARLFPGEHGSNRPAQVEPQSCIARTSRSATLRRSLRRRLASSDKLRTLLGMCHEQEMPAIQH